MPASAVKRLLATLLLSALAGATWAADHTRIRDTGIQTGGSDFSLDVTNHADGDDRLVVCAWGDEGTDHADAQQLSPTLGGTAMTFVGAQTKSEGAVSVHQEGYYCDETCLGVKTGSQTISTTGDGGTWEAFCTLYNGHAGTVRDFGFGEADSTSPVSVTGIDTVAGDLIHASVMDSGSAEGVASWSDGLTERWDANPNFDSWAGADTEEDADTTANSIDATGTSNFTNAIMLVMVFEAQAVAACAVDDASPVPGATINVSGCPAFAGNITTLTSPEGDTVTAEAGADTTSAAFIIPARDSFASGGSMASTRWDVDGTWTVGDGSTTEDLTLQVDPPATAGVDFFGQITRTGEPADSIWPDCCSSAVDNDDYYFEENSGTLAINEFCDPPNDAGSGVVCGTGEADVRWYDAPTGPWSAITTDTYTEDATAPVLSNALISSEQVGEVTFAWDTDEAGGEGYWGVCTESTRTCAQIQAGTCTGETNTGSPLTPTLGTNEIITSELEGGTYYGHTCQDDASANESNLLTSSSQVVAGSSPQFFSASVASNGTAVTIVSNEAVNIGSGGNGGFAGAGTLGAITLTYASGDGTTSLVYTAGRTINAGEGVTVDYTQPGDGIEDDVGNDLASFTEQPVTNNSTQDTVAPTLTSALINDDNVLRWNLSEAVSAGAGGSGGATLTCDGGAVTPTYDSGTNPLLFTLSRIIGPEEVCTTGYTQPGNGFEDAAGNDLATFSDQPVSLGQCTNDATFDATQDATQDSTGDKLCVGF